MPSRFYYQVTNDLHPMKALDCHGERGRQTEREWEGEGRRRREWEGEIRRRRKWEAKKRSRSRPDGIINRQRKTDKRSTAEGVVLLAEEWRTSRKRGMRGGGY